MEEQNLSRDEMINRSDNNIQEDIEWVDDAEKDFRNAKILSLRLLLFVLLLWILFGVILGVATVPNEDNRPSLHVGDILVYFRLNRKFIPNDVIVFKMNDTRYVGRIVAVSGDSVNITDGENVEVNGAILSEPNIYKSTPRFEGFVRYPLKLNTGEFFVLVDGRQGGEDSRYFGPVSTRDILGLVVTVFRRNNI